MSYYDTFNYRNFWIGRDYEDRSEKIALGHFFKTIGQKSSWLDIGSGYGRLALTILPQTKKLILVEPSEKLLSEAKSSLKGEKNVSFLRGSFPHLPLNDSSVDVITVIRVLHHLLEPQLAIKEITRVLSPGGFLILEFANKIHFLSFIKAILRFDFTFLSDLGTVEKRSEKNLRSEVIPFLNHHPKAIFNILRKNQFEIIDYLSVSNFRNPIIKKMFPLRFLLFFEKLLQRPLSRVFFGPSIFVLARKKE